MENPAAPTPEITPSPISTPPATKPPKKSYLPLILAVIIIFAISIFGGVLLGKYLYGPQTVTPIPTLAPKPTIIPTAIPTVYNEATQGANWKTYTNTKYGYTIKYPAEWNTKIRCEGGTPEDDYMCFLSPDFEEPPVGAVMGSTIKGGVVWEERVLVISPIDKFCTQDERITFSDCKEIVVNNQRAMQRTFAKEKITDVWIIENNKFVVGFRAVYNNMSRTEILDTFNQILSTFKFLDLTPTPPSTYTACGCGCCGGTTPKEQCLYKSKGDDLNKIIEEDKKATNSSQCATVGCSIGITYKYCD